MTDPGEGRTIVVVEDDVALARLLELGLQTEGYSVVVAHDGRTAVDVISEYLPSMVLLDGMLPALDGFGVLRELRANVATREIPVVFVSARNHPDIIMQALEAGATGFFSKPFEVLDVVAEVTRILSDIDSRPANPTRRSAEGAQQL